MTRKHFQMIANIVKNIDDFKVRHQVAMDFAMALKKRGRSDDQKGLSLRYRMVSTVSIHSRTALRFHSQTRERDLPTTAL